MLRPMPRPTILQMRQFYASRLGRQVKKRLRQLVLEYWPQVREELIVGIGYAPPLLRVLERGHAPRPTLLALMPAEQGAIYWPVHTDNRSVMCDARVLPLATRSVHRMVMLHLLEFEDQPEEVLKVAWQHLVPGGRLLLILPNRYGLWRLSRSPFARGRAFRMGQAKDLLEEAQFTLCDSRTALFVPPTARQWWWRASNIIEWVGHALLPWWGGVLVLEAEKQIYASIKAPVVEARRARWAATHAVAATERQHHS